MGVFLLGVFFCFGLASGALLATIVLRSR